MICAPIALYVIPATPDPPSLSIAESETFTFELFQPGALAFGFVAEVVEGATESQEGLAKTVVRIVAGDTATIFTASPVLS